MTRAASTTQETREAPTGFMRGPPLPASLFSTAIDSTHKLIPKIGRRLLARDAIDTNNPQKHLAVRRLEDGRRGSAVHAAGRVERVDAEELVDEAAGDAEHRRAAALALDVELEGLGLRVVVAHPRLAANVTGLAVADVGVALVVEEEVAGLHHAGGDHDLQPGRGRHRLERREEASRGGGAVRGREAEASLDEDDVEEAEHGRAAVLDLHDLEARHVARLDEAERVIDAERRQDTEVALREHGGRLDRRERLHGRRLEGGGGLEEREGDDGGLLHGYRK